MGIKSKLHKYCHVAAMWLVVLTGLNAQDNSISCLALVRGDSVVLRWVPGSLAVFQAGLKYGYVVKRFTIASNGVFIPDGLKNGRMLTKTPVRCLNNNEFETLALDDQRIAVVQEAIYGDGIRQSLPGDDFTTFMKIYEDLEMRLGFALFMCDMSPAAARAAGLQFTDKTVLRNERYAYSISLSNVPDGMNVEPAVTVVDAGEITLLPQILDVLGIFTDKAVRFRWPISFHKGIYSAYVLERSFDGKNFKPVSGLPLVNFSERADSDYFIYTDSLEYNNIPVWYRVKGISAFGETGPPSEIIHGKGIPEFSAFSSVDTAWVNENGKVILRWMVTEGNVSLVKGINILRSGSHNGSYEMLNRKPLSPGTREFTDNNPGVSNYYMVMLEGGNDIKSYSFPYFVRMEDITPPIAPRMLSGKVDSTGIATIIWKENEEPDLLGYKVFRSNSPDGEFIAIEQGIFEKNLFNDTISINTLTRKICYQVIAIDRNYNSSDYSDVLELQRPDTVAPAPAVIAAIIFSDEKIRLSLERSPANDISHYELKRKAENDSVLQNTGEWKKDLPYTFEEVPAVRGQNIEYTLVTYDKSGNSSANKIKVYVSPAEDYKLNLEAEQSADGRMISLRWEFPGDFIPVRTLIYRSMNSDPLVLYRTLDGLVNSYNDFDIELNTAYNYRLMIVSRRDKGFISSPVLKYSPFTGTEIK